MNLSFKEFEKNVITNALSLDKYIYIRNNVRNWIIKKENDEFQTTYNSFYRVRRDKTWRKVYFNYFYKNKRNTSITFEDILKYIYDKTGFIEASFSSKMLATIRDDMPIWDKYVIKTLFHIDGIYATTKEDQINKTIELYNQLIEKTKELLSTIEVQNTIKEVRKIIGSKYQLSDAKILDYILWSIRD